MPKYAFFRNKLVPIEEAKISIMTHAFNYGTGCFEGIRAYWNEEDKELYVFRLPEHFERMHRSCRILRIDLPYTPRELCDTTVELLRREGYREDAYIRPLAYKASEVIGVRLHDLEDAFAMFAVPFGRYIEKEEGAHVCISSWRRVDDNATPARAKITGAYINSALSKTDAQLSGYDEALVMTDTGHISEGSAENFFMVRNGCLVTPSVTSNILEGITRDTIIELAAAEMGLRTQQRSIDRSEVYICDEAFLVGTGVQVAAVTHIEHRPVGSGSIGPVVSRLRELYFDVVRGRNPKYKHWCTPVYG
ncbi:MAG: branched-chain amino acid transaminase [Anaerolineae bacterium]|jgi:branched-chain amino acid aminotransferase|nr:branched-chain amino acid transaminase [Anaerolineae bacterium]MDX9833277.1 branched-chain amino acid transaminase [Anaerolineae bacterium]